MLARARRFFDKDREPLRRKLYSVLIPLLSVAVGVGWLTGEEAASLSVAAASLLLIPAAEMARQDVSPTPPAQHRAEP